MRDSLATTEVHKLLPTIVSRCQVFNFKSISVKVLTQYLQQIASRENISIDSAALTLIARMTSGGLRDSLQLLSQLSLLDTPITSDHVIELTGGCSPQKLLSLIKAIASRDTFAVLQHSRELLDAGKPPELIFKSLLQSFRDLLIIKQVSLMQQDLELTKSIINYKELALVSSQWQLDDLQLAFEQLSTSQRQLQSNLNAATWLEVCLLGLIPKEFSVNKSQGRTPKVEGRTHEGAHSHRAATPLPQKELQQLWNRVIDSSTKPSNQNFLQFAQLVKLSEQQATLAVQGKYLKKFQAKQNAIASLMKRALKLRATPTLTITSL